ncbi:MAG: radical SAM protein [Coriobacteriales bacterium]|nr:radical SAM protein [Coriobacteriales bacterium]
MSPDAACSGRANERLVMANHPCFSEDAHKRSGRIHLPVAPACNLQCGYCVRKYDCVNESRPGVASVVLSPAEAIDRVEAVVERHGDIAAIGIAGPGDPLANEATFETLDLVRRRYPTSIGCVSTNGLALPERIGDLVAVGVRSLTVTINAVMPETAAEVYLWVTGPDGEKLRGVEAGLYLLERQWDGLRSAVAAGLVVKVNSVLIPGVNDLELPAVAHLASEYGAHMHNILPLIPQNKFRGLEPPTPAEIHAARATCGEYLSQMSHCKQCRADACGLIGKDRDMETEALYARLAEAFEEHVA